SVRIPPQRVKDRAGFDDPGPDAPREPHAAAPVVPVPGRAGASWTRLLELDGGAGALEGFLRLVGVVLGHALEHGLRGRLDEVLGFLEAEAGEAAHLLDDADLLVASVGEDDVEGGLLLGLLRVTAAARG